MISAVELYRWMKTYGSLIKTARITQVYRTGASELWWALHTKEGKKFLLTAPPEIIALSEDKGGEHKETGFGRWMRNTIKGAIIEEIEQVRSERIIKLTIRKGPIFYDIFIELFSQGNIIVCQDQKIIICLEKRQDIENGAIYDPSEKFDSFHSTDEEITAYIQTTEDMTTSKTLATQLGLGGAFAQEICNKLGIAEDAPKKELFGKPIAAAIQEILSQETTITPIQYLSKKEKVVENKKLKKIQVILEQQEKQKKQVLKSVDELTAAGEFIYNNYGFFEEAIQEYKKNMLDVETLKKKHTITATISYEKPTLIVEHVH